MKSGLYIASTVEEALEQALRVPIIGYLNGIPVRQVAGGAITASGMYGLTLEKMLIDAAGESMEAEDNNVLMVQDAHTPDFNAHNFRDDITDEVSGAGYSAGGKAITGTEITIAGGVLTFDAADVSWAASSITDAMAAVYYFIVGSAATDQLVSLSDFVTPASTTNGTFTIQWHSNGIITIDFTP